MGCSSVSSKSSKSMTEFSFISRPDVEECSLAKFTTSLAAEVLPAPSRNSGMSIGNLRMVISFVRLLKAINFPSGLSAAATSAVLSP